MGPIDYTLNVQNPLQASLAGYAGMAAVRNDQEEQAAYRQAQQQQQQLLQARQAVIQNPTAANFSSLMLLDPKSAEASQKAWEVRSQDQQRTFASDLGQWGAALINGQPQLVADALNKQADGIENTAGAPTPESQSKRDLAQLATTHPELALGKIVAILKSNGQVGGPVADSLMALQKLPSEVAKSKADATSATVDAAVKAASAPALAAKPAIDNARTQQETASSAINAKVAEFNAQINAANSQTERDKLTLERDKYVQEQAKLAQTQGQGVQDSHGQRESGARHAQPDQEPPGHDGLPHGARHEVGRDLGQGAGHPIARRLEQLGRLAEGATRFPEPHGCQGRQSQRGLGLRLAERGRDEDPVRARWQSRPEQRRLPRRAWQGGEVPPAHRSQRLSRIRTCRPPAGPS
jgi:hypothetical protein